MAKRARFDHFDYCVRSVRQSGRRLTTHKFAPTPASAFRFGATAKMPKLASACCCSPPLWHSLLTVPLSAPKVPTAARNWFLRRPG
jgi:hypothetical protein